MRFMMGTGWALHPVLVSLSEKGEGDWTLRRKILWRWGQMLELRNGLVLPKVRRGKILPYSLQREHAVANTLISKF